MGVTRGNAVGPRPSAMLRTTLLKSACIAAFTVAALLSPPKKCRGPIAPVPLGELGLPLEEAYSALEDRSMAGGWKRAVDSAPQQMNVPSPAAGGGVQHHARVLLQQEAPRSAAKQAQAAVEQAQAAVTQAQAAAVQQAQALPAAGSAAAARATAPRAA